MIQKVLKVGSSAAVTIPKDSLKELGLKIGDQVKTVTDTDKKTLTIMSAGATLSKEDTKIARLTSNFIERYRKDLEELADK
jgi:putative addiction module antidote